MIWMSHKKYTEQYVSEQFDIICTKVRKETRRMIMVAMGAVAFMAVVEVGYLYKLLQA